MRTFFGKEKPKHRQAFLKYIVVDAVVADVFAIVESLFVASVIAAVLFVFVISRLNLAVDFLWSGRARGRGGGKGGGGGGRRKCPPLFSPSS